MVTLDRQGRHDIVSVMMRTYSGVGRAQATASRGNAVIGWAAWASRYVREAYPMVGGCRTCSSVRASVTASSCQGITPRQVTR
ncbi:hypothetical protein AB0K12_47805 [Nonomuraea sp. NPDC049419]|uniref:hypothetical protein n=1 Tax=Nonomuraea sp. NPDC049419 TaxID=3155772 RepID=UPI00341BFED1